MKYGGGGHKGAAGFNSNELLIKETSYEVFD
jgi:nanoRNase/pAp phosphatase (c-di-AMP/oligoRNAs hydrolase)